MSDKILASEIRCRFLECQRILQTKIEDNGAGYGWLCFSMVVMVVMLVMLCSNVVVHLSDMVA